MTITERLGDRLLSNPRSERVRDVAALSRRSVRSRRGSFRAEGPQNVREALRLALTTSAAGEPRPAALPHLEAVYVTEAALARHPEIAADLSAVMDRGGVFVRAVSDDVLAAMTDAVTPQGMLCVCRVPEPSLERALEGARLVSVQVRVQDPGNAGTVIRAADAAGAGLAVFTTGSVDPYNPKAVRSTAGSLFHVPVLTGVEVAGFVSAARAAGLGVLAADGHAELTVDDLADAAAWRRAGVRPPGVRGHDAPDEPLDGDGLRDHRLERPTAWLFGNEAQGLSGEERALADVSVAVPLHGAAESLNVGMAATVCLYASARAQRPTGPGAPR